MQKKNVITLVEAIVIIFVLLFVFMLLLPIWRRFRHPHYGMNCGTNLKGLGTAMSVYANDYNGRFPQLPGSGPWSKRLGFDYFLNPVDFKEGGAENSVSRTITASWYLLVREADVSPKSFVCGRDQLEKRIQPFDGKNPKGYDPVELWDFGAEPHKHVSYAMHNPYGAYPTTDSQSSVFAVAADMNPWFHAGDFMKPDINYTDLNNTIKLMPPHFSDPSTSRNHIMLSNALAHGREGQNVTFADGHSEYVKTSDVGVKHDNIYTYWSVPKNPTESDIRIGTNPTSRSKDNDAKTAEDSFLAI